MLMVNTELQYCECQAKEEHLRRSVQKLYPIEMAVVTTDQNQTQCEPEPEPEDDVDATPIQQTDRFGDCGPTVRRRPRRAAALAAEDRLVAQALDQNEDDDDDSC